MKKIRKREPNAAMSEGRKCLHPKTAIARRWKTSRRKQCSTTRMTSGRQKPNACKMYRITGVIVTTQPTLMTSQLKFKVDAKRKRPTKGSGQLMEIWPKAPIIWKIVINWLATMAISAAASLSCTHVCLALAR